MPIIEHDTGEIWVIGHLISFADLPFNTRCVASFREISSAILNVVIRCIIVRCNHWQLEKFGRNVPNFSVLCVLSKPDNTWPSILLHGITKANNGQSFLICFHRDVAIVESSELPRAQIWSNRSRKLDDRQIQMQRMLSDAAPSTVEPKLGKQQRAKQQSDNDFYGLGAREMFNTLRPRQNGRLFADDTFKRIFLNENIRISIKISLKFVPKGLINNISALVLIMAWRRPGDKPLSEPMMVSLPTHICVTRPQWIKKCYPKGIESLRPSDAYMRQNARPLLVQIMPCRLIDAKSLSGPIGWVIVDWIIGN